MLKHLPAAVFFLCLTAAIINVSLFERWDLFLGAVVVGTLAMTVQYLMELRQKKAETPDREQQVVYWRNQRAHVSATLTEARQRRDDRVPFLESQLAEAERQLRKLGVAKDSL